tara:strand:- start:84 stop:602 length:519 start_codon:yes stop_codon:yes gene_type:complete
METMFAHNKFIYKVNISEKISEVFGYKYYHIDCIRILSEIKPKKRLLLAKMIKQGILCEDIVLHILSFRPYKHPRKECEYVTRNFLSDNFIRIIMMDKKKISFEKGKFLFLKTLQNGSRVKEEKARDIFKCITSSCYPILCEDCLNIINFNKINDWGTLKLRTFITLFLFYN